MNGGLLSLQKSSQFQSLPISPLLSFFSSLLFSSPSKSLPSLSLTPQTLLLSNSLLPSHQFESNFASDSSTGSISSTGSSSLFCTANPSSQILNLHNFRWFRSFSVSSSSGLNASRKQVYRIINLIRRGQKDLEPKLDGMNVSLSEASLKFIFRNLNSQKVSALRFFNWIQQSHPQFRHGTDICSLVIDNCGRLDDFDSMFSLLNDFRLHGICLNQRAFRYLSVMISDIAKTKEYIYKTVEMLNRIGGPCGVGGIHALIEMFSALGFSEMARYVVANTDNRLSNYNVLIRESCRRGDFKEAIEILDDEMIKGSCNPNSQTFNYILGCLCKNHKVAEACQLLEKMEECGCPPDALTFEIFIHYLCQLGMLDMASEWLDKMMLRGVEPRIMTHAAFIKGYFELQQYEEAHKYVVVYSDKYKKVGNMIYSLLANLHNRRRKEPVMAQSILSEMIEKGLKPNFRVFKAVKERLQNSGRDDLAINLETSFSRFNQSS